MVVKSVRQRGPVTDMVLLDTNYLWYFLRLDP